MNSTSEKAFSTFDIFLIVASGLAIIISYLLNPAWIGPVLAGLSFLGLIPVALSALKAVIKKHLSVDLLATIALVFSLLSHEWLSASFITLMLAFARLFERITASRAKRTIQSLMEFSVDSARVRDGETVREVPIGEVKPGDELVVHSGDRMPVDGIVISGQADVDESSLTGESELVPKRTGDRVFTSTMNESGSLIVRAEKVGADTTLSRIIDLVEKASRGKNQSEKTADKFTQWYIFIILASSAAMYLYGLSPRVILSVLLVVCADDIAVAVPLAFTVAMSRAAKRGVIVKGSTVLEQLARLRYVLTDKTGTLTSGKPHVLEVKTYEGWTTDRALEYFGMGASESRHMVSRAILRYIADKGMKIHAPHESKEISGQGVSFEHDNDRMLMGRLSFLENEKCVISEAVKKDIQAEKDAGRSIVVLAFNGQAVGRLSYSDEIRPHTREIIAETKELGVLEWHMLTGDNIRSAEAVAGQLGIRNIHANMTPETKVAFVRQFEDEHSGKGVVGYIGDGVNDAASLALADVSIAMGGIGSDAAIEAADITIMKDDLGRIPEIMHISHSVRSVMWQNFGLWGLTNAVGLGLVVSGLIGPAGAATYNFLTDFITIGNAFRAGRGKRHPSNKLQ